MNVCRRCALHKRRTQNKIALLSSMKLSSTIRITIDTLRVNFAFEDFIFHHLLLSHYASIEVRNCQFCGGSKSTESMTTMYLQQRHTLVWLQSWNTLEWLKFIYKHWDYMNDFFLIVFSLHSIYRWTQKKTRNNSIEFDVSECFAIRNDRFRITLFDEIFCRQQRRRDDWNRRHTQTDESHLHTHYPSRGDIVSRVIRNIIIDCTINSPLKIIVFLLWRSGDLHCGVR